MWKRKVWIKCFKLGTNFSKFGAGELLITSIDHEGMKKGMDMKLLKELRKFITIPIIFGGGAGSINDIKKTIPEADAVALASILHYNNLSIENIRREIG